MSRRPFFTSAVGKSVGISGEKGKDSIKLIFITVFTVAISQTSVH